MFDTGALLEMLKKARQKNTALGITGLLLHNNGNFLQLIEGSKENVTALFNTISNDDRHRDIIVLISESTNDRLFPEWSMGLREITTEEFNRIPGLSNYFGEHASLIADNEIASKAMQLIAMFRSNNH